MVDGDITSPSKTSENSENGKRVADENPHLQPDSLYYVHPAENPTTVLYQPVLSDGKINKPTKSADIPYWKRCDDLVGSWVWNSCEPEIGRSIMSFDTAHEMWMNLKSRFAQSNATNMYAIKQAISNLKQEDNIVDQVSNLRSQLLVTEPLPSTAKLYNLIRQEEEQQVLNSLVVHNVDSTALNVSRHDPRSNRSFPSTNNGASSSNKKCQQPFCDHCNKHGHTRLICWKLVSYPKDTSRSYSRALASVVVHVPIAPSITAEQYARILSLLDPANGDIKPSANFAEPTNEQGDWME
ncbi:uncharacterized protein LOC113359073 [Papaver somniferum]|uniref:uncharacterized protein LOC113359073 n=1 Tax=Papaver somniferum TaxID=3469 RepID=UPI000E6FD9AC|nr:uncharacterized protein LOC113359073 [Papaver somniferum]